MLDLNWLNTFVTLARLEHFGKTASELHMTQPNVSLHIKQLEQATRVKLIERNPFRLTQAGERLLQSAQMTLQELQVCQSDLNAINNMCQGTLSIAASDIISRWLLIRPFQLFKQEFPGMDLSLFNTTSSQAAELVKSAKADVGFVIAQKESQPLHFTELCRVQWCALGNGLSEWQCRAKDGEIHTGDEPTLILLGHDTRTRDLIDLALPSLGLPQYRVMEVGSVDAQIRLLPEFPQTSLGYIVRQNQVLSRATKQLLNWVREEIARSPQGGNGQQGGECQHDEQAW